ncbi:hypothetical protein U9M48_010616 [Paspalum notatum var. saurae]|uniref:Uncharacterized protein n=1 Tax=Paspalum notatum var. saurae TaxID=547442 RepID=A0AAQ3STU3_PASNO
MLAHTILFKDSALSLIPSSPSRSSTLSPISSLVTMPCSLAQILKPFRLKNWSAKYGQHRNGTPWRAPSIVEFHPQCEMKHATERCESTRCWGAQPTTSPLPSTRLLNRSSQPSSTPLAKFGRSTHRNGRPVSASPSASSWSLVASKTITELGSWASSQARQVGSSGQSWPAEVDAGASRGPTASAAIGRRDSASDSMSWNVLQTMASASENAGLFLSNPCIMILRDSGLLTK